MKYIVILLLVSCIGCSPDYEELARQRAEQREVIRKVNAERQERERVALEETKQTGRRAFNAGIPATANPETFDSYRCAWFLGYLEAAEEAK